jgi:hypothetical protein
MKILLIMIIIVAFAAGCVQQSVDPYSCAYDRDCVKVSAGCCGCNESGKAIAINKNFADQWNANLTKECGQTACIQSISNDPSCSAEPKCVNYKCGLMKNG